MRKNPSSAKVFTKSCLWQKMHPSLLTGTAATPNRFSCPPSAVVARGSRTDNPEEGR